ncbi:MipA/OmpV family protein [Roseateles koreensis]|uniref:MipA/OmpV family protein n=1 Tax=Roseateles koreensis TaxID=2987526 RepID=A0ABT5KN40_9BURK|nr:MipA/OmpV family protein [Roseateles koreensis]MDC8784324.1 MipA/OmpV family protein [Roseateles koreensis]
MTSTIRNKTLPISFALLACLGLAATAQAQSFDAYRNYGAKVNEDGGTLGLAALSVSKYRGAQDGKLWVVPILDYRWANGFFAGVRNGLGYDFSRSEETQYGLRLTADLGRKESDDNHLRGMGDIKIRPEIGGFYNLALSPSLQLTSSLRYGAGEQQKGLLLDLGVSYHMALTRQWVLGMGAGLSVANSDYMQEFFGVSTAQSLTSAYAATQAKGGVRDVRANVLLNYYLSPTSGISFGLSAGQLMGDAKNSPLTQKSSTMSGLLAYSQQF